MPIIRFFFDAGSGTALWAASAEGWERWGCAIDLRQLPISQALRDDLTSLIAQYDTSLNWDYPLDPGPWREPQCQRFNHVVQQVTVRLRAELGPTWQIHDAFNKLHEDPDLDRYLVDRAGFTRSPR